MITQIETIIDTNRAKCQILFRSMTSLLILRESGKRYKHNKIN